MGAIMEGSIMSIGNLVGRAGRTVAAAAAIAGTIGLTAAPQPAHALGTGAAVGIGVGALALRQPVLLSVRLLLSARGLLLPARAGLSRVSGLPVPDAELLEPVLPDLRRLLGGGRTPIR